MARRDYEKQTACRCFESESGKRATITEYQTIIETELLDGGMSQIGGAKRYSANIGASIHRINNETFLIDDEIYRDVDEFVD